ncbi:unnamed protein product, partial [Cyprideis torosa]
MKLWDKGFNVNEKIEQFTVGKDRELDAYLAYYDVLGTKAHANMLCSVGLLSEEENKSVQAALVNFEALTLQDDFLIEEDYEDIHSFAENLMLDLYYFGAAYEFADQNPLGSGAGYGSSFPLDREQTTKELGFKNMLIASTSAQILRGKLERSIAVMLN